MQQQQQQQHQSALPAASLLHHQQNPNQQPHRSTISPQAAAGFPLPPSAGPSAGGGGPMPLSVRPGVGGSGGGGGGSQTPTPPPPYPGRAPPGVSGGPGYAPFNGVASGAELLANIKASSGSGGGVGGMLGTPPPGLGGVGGPAGLGSGGGAPPSSGGASVDALFGPSAGVASADIGGGASRSTATAGSGGVSSYGLAGLLPLVSRSGESAARDTMTFTLGSDLSTTGLALGSAEPLLPSFASPWARDPTALEPTYSLPASYRQPQPALKTGHLNKFEVTTLMYIFYSMPKDLLQSYAAQELCQREWKYHKDLKLWFKKEPQAPGAPVYTYFDVTSWEKRPYAGPMHVLANNFLTLDECLVRART